MIKKEKIVMLSTIIFIGTLFNLFFTTFFDIMLLNKDINNFFLHLLNCLTGITKFERQSMIFINFECLLLLCGVLFVFENKRTYQSELKKVTDDIFTPSSVGQFQHGSSRWLAEKEKDKIFDFYILNPSNEIISDLIKTGYNNLDFIKNKETDEKIKNTDNVKSNESKDNIQKTKNTQENKEKIKGDVFNETVDYTFKADNVKKPCITANKTAEKKGEEQPKNDKYKLIESGGIVIGMTKEGNKEKIHYISDDTHTLTVGATRSGKTRTLVLQSICLLGLAGESMVMSDPKAELFEYTSEFLQKIGYEVICIDFRNTEKSTRYNLLQPVIDAVKRNDIEKAEMYAWDITNILVGDNTSQEKIWENGEKSIIAASILCVVYDNINRPDFQNLTNVYWFVAEMNKPIANTTPMQEYVKTLKPDHPARALLSISDIAPSRTKGSFFTSALTTLRLFTSKSVYAVTNRSDYDIADMGRKKQALFVILPDEKTTYYPIASLIVSQLYELLVKQADERGGRLINRVNFLLDEFGNFTKIEDFTNKLTVAGGRGIRFNLFLQSFEQLTEKYSKETASIVKSNCQTWVYLQADDKETLQEISDKLGKYTTSSYQLSGQYGKFVNPTTSNTLSLTARELLTIDEVRRISRPYQMVMSRSYPAMMKSPDLSQWYFNKILGLGDKEHNRKVREEREKKRPVVTKELKSMPLWNIWAYYKKDIMLKEQRKQKNMFMPDFDSIFENQKDKKE